MKTAPFNVSLLRTTEGDPLLLTTHAAKTCYSSEIPDMEELEKRAETKPFDVENSLFKTSHHTTLQHFSFNFSFDGISVGDITLGFHLASPFYNSDQRSGRFSKMFNSPDFEEIERYISWFWPEVSDNLVRAIICYARRGVEIYQEHLTETAEAAAEEIRRERPKANEDYIKTNAPKIAQEQLRVFIPVIFPTGFDFTVNLSALAAMWHAAWTPPMIQFTDVMAKLITDKFPKLWFAFDHDRDGTKIAQEWGTSLLPRRRMSCKYKADNLAYKPTSQLEAVDCPLPIVFPEPHEMHPVDLLHFHPRFMNNNINNVRSAVEISLACMGQDQRHRTVMRSEPEFTGKFYMPPLVRWEKKAYRTLSEWRAFQAHLPPSLFAVIAPYGAMVRYKKRASLNALFHEQAKRLCWCAQEEIYHVSRALREGLLDSKHPELARALEPHCYRTGKCAEGKKRYCGRNLQKCENYFPLRTV